jgi:hypothetical protein
MAIFSFLTLRAGTASTVDGAGCVPVKRQSPRPTRLTIRGGRRVEGQSRKEKMAADVGPASPHRMPQRARPHSRSFRRTLHCIDEKRPHWGRDLHTDDGRVAGHNGPAPPERLCHAESESFLERLLDDEIQATLEGVASMLPTPLRFVRTPMFESGARPR